MDESFSILGTCCSSKEKESHFKSIFSVEHNLFSFHRKLEEYLQPPPFLTPPNKSTPRRKIRSKNAAKSSTQATRCPKWASPSNGAQIPSKCHFWVFSKQPSCKPQERFLSLTAKVKTFPCDGMELIPHKIPATLSKTYSRARPKQKFPTPNKISSLAGAEGWGSAKGFILSE